jgi:hypothetical protein
MEAPHFVAAASLLSASDTDAAELVPVSFFVAWNGVLALVYEGFPPGLVDIKAKLTNALPVSPEKFGSLWPKTTLAALHDESPLSLAELETLRGLCEEHAAALPPIALDSVSSVESVQRGLELVRREHRQPLRPLAAGAAAVRAATTEVERVQGVLREWSDLREYLPRVNAPGSRAASYRELSPFGCTCVAFLPGEHPVRARLARFRAAVDAALPGRYAWLSGPSLHCTLRALDPAPDAPPPPAPPPDAPPPDAPPAAPPAWIAPPPVAAFVGARDLAAGVAGCGVRYVPGALAPAEAAALFAALAQLPWRTETDAFGPQSRETFYCADPAGVFTYVGLRLPPAVSQELLSARPCLGGRGLPRACCSAPQAAMQAPRKPRAQWLGADSPLFAAQAARRVARLGAAGARGRGARPRLRRVAAQCLPRQQLPRGPGVDPVAL